MGPITPVGLLSDFISLATFYQTLCIGIQCQGIDIRRAKLQALVVKNQSPIHLTMINVVWSARDDKISRILNV